MKYPQSSISLLLLGCVPLSQSYSSIPIKNRLFSQSNKYEDHPITNFMASNPLLRESYSSTIDKFTNKKSFQLQSTVSKNVENTTQNKTETINPYFDAECDTNISADVSISVSPVEHKNEAKPLDTKLSVEDNNGEAINRLGHQTGPTVWTEFGRLAQENKVANLGQGFPDWLPPKFAVESLVEAATDTIDKSPHQYTRTAGHVSLVKELSRRYSFHLKKDIDPMNEVAVTVGASQALYLSLQTLVKPGDEVILFEPFFDLYVNQVKLAGGTPVFVPLSFVSHNIEGSVSGGEWVLEPQRLRDALTPNTRAIVLNSPHNPTGKIFTRTEMESIASAIEDDASDRCVVLSDEVYKYIVHSPCKEDTQISNNEKNQDENTQSSAITCPGHTHFASLPRMYERTITVSSAGKTFSATGWQVGWCIGPPHLITPIHQLLPYVQFCASTVIQDTLARTLQKAELPYEGYGNYYEYLISKYTRKRDQLGSALKKAGFGIPEYATTPGGGFFIFARIGPDILKALPKDRLMVPNPAAPGGVARTDWALCQWMAEEKGILCIPSSPFFSEESVKNGLSDEFVRIAFCKTEETIEEAATAFMRLSDGGVNGEDSS